MLAIMPAIIDNLYFLLITLLFLTEPINFSLKGILYNLDIVQDYL